MKTHQEIAEEYLRCFCDGDIDGLVPLLSQDLYFRGTFHSYHSSQEYLDSLRADAPQKSDYQILSMTDNDEDVAVFYEYHKPNRVMQIAQLFRIRDQKIAEVILVFDGRGFD